MKIKLSPTIAEAMSLFTSKAIPDSDPTPPPTHEELQAAERALGSRLPHSFYVLLQKAGALHIDFWETLLVGSEQLAHRNIVTANLALRSDAGVRLPAFLIAFAYDGSGGFYFFDTRHVGPEQEFPVRHWEHECSFDENTSERVHTYEYFPQWLIEEMETSAA